MQATTPALASSVSKQLQVAKLTIVLIYDYTSYQ